MLSGNVSSRYAFISFAEHGVSFPVHPDLQGLLWFADGSNLNYGAVRKCDGKDLWREMDPCVITLALTIKKPISGEGIPRLPYDPSYSLMQPSQRWRFLEFLSNPYCKDYEIGYFYIVYYALERRLKSADYESAIGVITKLVKCWDEKFFANYSFYSIAIACMENNAVDVFLSCIESFSEVKFTGNRAAMLLYCLYKLNIPVAAKYIVTLSYDVGFRNEHYLKNNYDALLESLEKVIEDKTGGQGLPLNEFFERSENLKTFTTPVYVNAALKKGKRNYAFPNLMKSQAFKEFCYDLLASAHVLTKDKIKRRRNALKYAD